MGQSGENEAYQDIFMVYTEYSYVFRGDNVTVTTFKKWSSYWLLKYQLKVDHLRFSLNSFSGVGVGKEKAEL